MNRSSPRKGNPFDEFPRRYGGRTTKEKMGYRSYVEYSAEDDPEKWREKWETYILDMLYVADQAIKWGHVEVHEGDPTTFTVHCSASKVSEGG